MISCQRNNSRKRKIGFKIFLFLIFFIAIGYAVFSLYKRYSFTKERANLETYLGVKGEDVAIYLNDELQVKKDDKVKKTGLAANETVYIPLSFVKASINDRFYYAKDIKKILYCVPDEIRSHGDSDIHQIGNAPYIIFKDEPYLLIDFVKDYTNIRYDKYIDEESKRVYIYSDWDKENIAYIKSKESARLTGGNKSPIITDLKKGEEVKILEKMTKWIKVKTANGYIGYIRKTKINNEIERIPSSSYIERTRITKKMDAKPCIGFHQLYSNYPANKLPEVLKNAKDMNVIAPTWFVIRNNDGDIRSIANDKYSLSCHARKLQVWATVNNFDLEDIDEKKIFSNTMTRRKMIDKILREVEVNNLDGLNLDIEQVDAAAGDDYMQFVRELSIELTRVGCIFSVDTYVPYAYNKQYKLKEFNDFCDYVIVMCYDEHYSGSSEAGSVSSLPFVRDGINLSLADVDKDKLIIALPFYSRIWNTSPEGKVTSAASAAQICYDAAVNQGLKFEFDEEKGQDYGLKIKIDGGKVECWAENEKSLNYKMSEIRKADVAGTAGWKLTQENETFFSIINLNKDFNNG